MQLPRCLGQSRNAGRKHQAGKMSSCWNFYLHLPEMLPAILSNTSACLESRHRKQPNMNSAHKLSALSSLQISICRICRDFFPGQPRANLAQGRDSPKPQTGLAKQLAANTLSHLPSCFTHRCLPLRGLTECGQSQTSCTTRPYRKCDRDERFPFTVSNAETSMSPSKARSMARAVW